MSGSTILCVDDDPVNLAVLDQILGADYDLTFARSGEEALWATEKHRPDLVLLDVRMPDLDGFEVALRLQSHLGDAAPPVIFVTSCNEELDEEAGFDVGGVDYIAKPFSPKVLRARVRAHLSLVRTEALERSYHDAIQMLGEAGHHNDTDTGVHIWRMAAYARILAQAVGWTAERARLLELAAPMHDTGKIGIPDAILRKPGPLNDEEWTIMRTHTTIGHEILRRSAAPVFKMAAAVALHHHERWDGTGYPCGLAGNDIPEAARIVAIADVFDALCSRRPYKAPWPLDRVVMALSENAGKQFDPQLIDAFLDIMPDILRTKEYWDAQERQETQLQEAAA